MTATAPSGTVPPDHLLFMALKLWGPGMTSSNCSSQHIRLWGCEVSISQHWFLPHYRAASRHPIPNPIPASYPQVHDFLLLQACPVFPAWASFTGTTCYTCTLDTGQGSEVGPGSLNTPHRTQGHPSILTSTGQLPNHKLQARLA